MKAYSFRPSILIVLSGFAVALASFGCGSSTSGNGSGGSGGNAKGGSGGSAPTGGTGGSPAASTGGSAGGSAVTGTGGAAGGSAVTGTGGGAGSSQGGKSGSAGGGGVAAPKLDYTFDSSTDGFTLQTYVDTGTYKNLGALAADAGVPDGGTYPTLSFNSTAGSPSPGSLQVTADFTDYNQYVEVLLGLSSVDLTGTTLTALVQVNPAFNGGAFLYVKTGPSYVYGSGSGVTLTGGSWVPLSLDLSAVAAAGGDAGIVPAMVREIGIHIYSAGLPAGADAGAFVGGTETFLIDSVIAE
jgi:hypothetical protein